MKIRKVLICTSFFEERFGYQEVHLANTLSKMGSDVMVLTSDRSPFTKIRLEETNNSKYTIVRIDKNIRIIDTLLPLRPLNKVINDFDPDIALIIHIGHGLPYFSLNKLNNRVKKISFFGDLTRQHSSFRRKIIQKFIKDKWYYNTFKKSDLIVANTNETVTILSDKAKWKKQLTEKIFRSSLGFDSEKFYYSIDKRTSERKKLNFKKDQKIFCTTTKIVQRKPIIKWISPIIDILRKNSNIVYCLAGFMDDEHSKKKLIEIRDIYSGDNLRLLPLLSYKKLNDLYNASDYSIWFDASITIQESMGTGLKIIIPNSKRVNHLVDDENGYFFDDILDIPKLITDVPKDYNRDELVKNNLKYSYDSIVLNIIDQLNFG